MTRLEALRDLLGKVEHCTHIETGDIIGNRSLPRDLVDRRRTIVDAFNGSHDAAKALHDAVPTSGAIMTPEEMDAVLFHPLGARIWLAWKIQALIAKETAND